MVVCVGGGKDWFSVCLNEDEDSCVTISRWGVSSGASNVDAGLLSFLS